MISVGLCNVQRIIQRMRQMNCNCIYLHLKDAFVLLLVICSTGKEQHTKKSCLITIHVYGVSSSLIKWNCKMPESHGNLNYGKIMILKAFFIK